MIQKRSTTTVDLVRPEVLAWGDGTWTYLDGGAVYPSREVAADAWRRRRREVWSVTQRWRLPRAAAEYDGLTDTAWNACYFGLSHVEFPLAEVLAACRRDREAVTSFRRSDPAGAESVHDFLDAWLEALATIEAIARRAARHVGGDRPTLPTTTHTYAEACGA